MRIAINVVAVLVASVGWPASTQAQVSSDGEAVVGLLVLAGLAVVYLLPWLIARARGHHNSLAIFWLNLLAG